MSGRLALSCLAIAAAACGGGSSPSGPTPIAAQHDVTGLVFLDENGNGSLDAGEGTRVPGVEVEIAGRRGVSEKGSGRVVVSGVPAGAQTARVRPASLPQYFQAAAPLPVQVPSGQLSIPVKLPEGTVRPWVYMAFGDSLTLGDGSERGEGYLTRVQSLLRAHFGRGDLNGQGIEGSRTEDGARRIVGMLSVVRPGYTLILYGTNDWNDRVCRDAPPCYTLDSLRSMARASRAAGSLPVIATIPPANTGFSSKAPPDRNEWIHDMNQRIRALLRQEGVPIADVEAAFLDAGDLAELFVDHVHPNGRGYALIADAFFRALSEPLAGAAAGFEDAGGQAWGAPEAFELLARPAPAAPRRALTTAPARAGALRRRWPAQTPSEDGARSR